MKRIATGLVTVLVVAVLSGLGLAAARPEWMPAWARFAPASPVAEDAGLYCKEHGVPEKFCTLCHEELTKTLVLCKEHGDIPEDVCTLCHPEAEAKYNIEMCKNHGLPKHFCIECGKGPAAMQLLPDDGWCAVHDKPESLCEECLQAAAQGTPFPSEPAGDAKVCRMPLPTVRLASASLARKIGIQTAEVTEENHAHTLLANAETAYDANHYADVTPRVSGFIREVKVDLGRTVRQGDVLAVVDSPEVSTAKTIYLTSTSTVELAQVTADRTRQLSKAGALPGKLELEALTALNQARAAVMDAEQKLRNLGFDDDALKQIIDSKDTRNLLTIVAPIDGTVVLRHAVKGEAVQPTSQIFTIVDTSRMWLWIDVYESDVAAVKPGQKVRFVVSGSNQDAFAGTINWIGTEVNLQTRTTRSRAELANPQGRLRANQFGQAEIQVGDEHKAVIVPRAAVQRKDGVDLVFLPLEEEGAYRPQRIVAKRTDHDDVLEVVWGLKPGQRVVTKGSFLFKTEIMKGAIGAGCCE